MSKRFVVATVVCMLVYLAHCGAKYVVAGELDSPTVLRARQELHATRQALGNQSRAVELANQLALDDLQRALYAEIETYPDLLQQTIAKLKSTAQPELRRAEWQRLATTLEALVMEQQGYTREHWPVLCDEAAKKHQPISPQQFAARQVELRAELERFDRRLRGFGALQAKWNDFLYWPETLALASETDFDPSKLDRLETRWTNAPLVWNDRELQDLARAVRSFARFARAFHVAETADQQAAAWKEIATLVQADASSLNAPQREQLASLVKQRARLGQTPELLAAIERGYSHPNIHIAINAQRLRQSLAKPIDERFAVNDVIGGTRATGNGRLTGEIDTRLLPSDIAGRFAFHLKATSTASTTATESGVRVESRGTTTIAAERRFTWDGSGVRATDAAVVANTNITYDNIASGGRAIRRNAAENQVYARRAQAEADASAAARRSTRERLHQQTDTLAEQFNVAFRERLRDPWTQSNAVTPVIGVRTTSEAILWNCRLNGLDNFAALQPPSPAPNDDLCLQFHATALERHAQATWGGKRISGESLLTDLRRLTGVASAADEPPADWHLTFAEQPLSLQLGNNTATLELHLTQFEYGEASYPAMTLTVNYAVQAENGQLQLQRDGTLRVRFNGEDAAAGGRAQTLRLAIQRRLGRVLESEFIVGNISLTEAVGHPALLRTATAVAHDGWLQWTLQHAEPGIAAASEP
ncbi:MAG TPA: hypothetical protein VL096_02775 [Pirellulaceae bacterium]|nr:hypothetical protein [Pirellulaceae bacterium]